MITTFKINGQIYRVQVESITQEFIIQDGPNAGETMGGLTVRDLIGSKVKYLIKVSRNGNDFADYDKLFEVISNPHESYTIEMPHGQGWLQYKGYVTSGRRDLLLMKDGRNYWGPTEISFVGQELWKAPRGV